MQHRLGSIVRRVILGLVAALLLGPSVAAAQGDPLAPPPGQDGYYVPPGYSSDPPAAQPYPAPVQPPPAAEAQPYPAQTAQPYLDPRVQPYRGRPRLERLRRDEPPPPGVEVVERRRRVLIYVGAGVFGGSYVLPVVAMMNSGLPSRRVFLPIAGVLLENAHSDYLFQGSWGLAVLDAGVQALGVTLFALGMRRERYAIYYVNTARGRTLALSPAAGPRGLSLHMTF